MKPRRRSTGLACIAMLASSVACGSGTDPRGADTALVRRPPGDTAGIDLGGLTPNSVRVGVFRANGDPVVGARLALYPPDLPQGVTDGNGLFVFRRVPPKQYILFAAPPEGYAATFQRGCDVSRFGEPV